MVGAFIEDAHQKKHHSRAGSMVEHLQNGSVHPLSCHGRKPQHDKTHMGNGGVGDEFLDIRLSHGTKGTINNIDQPEPGYKRGSIPPPLGEK